MILDTDMLLQNNSERPVGALAEKGESLTHLGRESKNQNGNL